MRCHTILAVTLTAVVATPLVAAPPDLDERLERFAQEFDAKREELHVPGAAVAIVLDDQVVFARGFGVSDIETQEPVTAETMFAIGSSSKAFTATLIGMLVDEGKMGWDDPVTDYLPLFQLDIDGDADDVVTIRDLLCHRTGFTRMGLLWASGTTDRGGILRTATNAEPYAGFRERFLYNNVMFLAAGVSAGVASDSTWNELLHTRLLDPLGMTNSNSTYAAAQEDGRLSSGYMWEEGREDYRQLPMRRIDAIGPAGSINSNVLDMTNWLRLQLGRGVIDGNRLVSEAVIDETWTEQISVGGGIGYGLGWMTRSWSDHRLIEHGGNIDGFAAAVGLLPDDGLGIVMLSNVTATPLQSLVHSMAADAILGDDSSEAVAGAAEIDLDEYVGDYIANFGPFDNATFAVTEKDGSLAVDVPGQTNYELKRPNEEGRWVFAMTDTIQVSFNRDDEGNVYSLNMHQGGGTFEIVREGVEIPAEVEIAEVASYLGLYRDDALDANISVIIQNGRLAADVPGQMIFETHRAGDDGRWNFRAFPNIAFSFNTDETGKVVSMTLDERGTERVLERVGDLPAETAPPTMDEVLAVRDLDALDAGLDAWGTWRLYGRVHHPQAGITGDVIWIVDGDDRFRQEVDYGEFGHSLLIVTEEGAYTESTYEPARELEGVFLDQSDQAHPHALVGDWRDVFDTVVVLRREDLDERPCLVLRLTDDDTPNVTAWVDSTTGELIRIDGSVVIPGAGQITIESGFGDYREIAGVMFPFRWTTENEASGIAVTEVLTIETGATIDDGQFTW